MIFGANISAIVFDMDGVLWHSSAIHAQAYRAVLAEAKLEMPDYMTIAGRRTDEVMRDLLATQRPAQPETDCTTVAALTEAKQATARQLLRDNPPIAMDCVAVLGTLAQSRDLALASSASAGTIGLFLDMSGTRSLFKAVVSGKEVTTGKPDPAIYVTALQRLHCDPSVAAVVEDAPSGIQAARAAGVLCVVGVEGTAPREALIESGASQVVRTLRDLVT
jgi:beta-phosphoglucomutase